MGLAVAAGAGLAGWAAHPPVGAWPLILLVVPGVLTAVTLVTPPTARGRRRWLPAVAGFVAGLVAFLPMLRWLVLPAGYVAWVLLAAVQAVWYAAAAQLLGRWVRSPWIVLVAPLVWAGMEGWRNAVPLSGFGWGMLAVAHSEQSWLLPMARVVGAPGLNIATALLGALAFWVGRTLGSRGDMRTGIRATSPALAGLAGAALLPLAAPGPPMATGRSVNVLAVQGNDLTGFTGGQAAEDRAIARRMLAETRGAVATGGKPDLTVWPESSIDRDPFTPTGADLRPVVREAARLVGGGLLTGMKVDGPRPQETFVNSLVLLRADGRPAGRYAKRVYVPFGEYVPARRLLEWIPALDQVPRDGVAVPHPQVIPTPVGDVAAVICFETLFPEVVASNVRTGDAGLVVAATNDASFGRSAESAQHIAQSRLRAVETGRWVIHAALSGQSALIDPSGVVRQRTGLFERATIRADVPVVTTNTLFVRLGGAVDTGVRWAALVLVLGQVVARRRRT